MVSVCIRNLVMVHLKLHITLQTSILFSQTVEGPVDPGRDMETLPAEELVSECDTEFELESRPDLDTSHLLDPCSDLGAESDTSLFTPQPQR